MLTLNPETVFLDFETPTWKRPSPSTKPANQLGSLIPSNLTARRGTGRTSGKLFLNKSDNTPH